MITKGKNENTYIGMKPRKILNWEVIYLAFKCMEVSNGRSNTKKKIQNKLLADAVYGNTSVREIIIEIDRDIVEVQKRQLIPDIKMA